MTGSRVIRFIKLLFTLGALWLPNRAAVGATDEFILGQVWSGSPTPFGAVWRGGYFFVAFYNPERRITVQKVDQQGTVLEQMVLDEVFEGWDAHNSLAIEVDEQHLVHLSGNMHATPLLYYRGTAPYSVKTLSRVSRMTGKDEVRVTYPRFLLHNGKLLFSYRSGGSGNGTWFLNRFVDGQWHRVGERGIFADRDATGRVSAYPTQFVADGIGGFGVAYTWRRGPDASLNTKMCFARTRDFESWTSMDGGEVRAPLGTSCLSPVVEPGPNRGLTNNQLLFFAKEGRPIIIFHMLDASGNNQVFLASFRDGEWRSQALTRWTGHFDFSGAGSVPTPFGIGATQSPSGEQIIISARHDGFPMSTFYVDRTTLAVTSGKSPEVVPKLPSPGPAVTQTNKLPIVDEAQRPRGALTWTSLRPNRDLPPPCWTSHDHPCVMPSSVLRLSVNR